MRCSSPTQGVVRITCDEALEGITQLNRLTDLRLAVTVGRRELA
jgi:hypothetical protein